MTGWARWSTGNCARNLNLTIRTNGICTTQNSYWRMRCKISSRILATNGSPNLGQKTRPYNNQPQKKKRKKKRTWKIVDFAVPADHRIKLKESEKKDKYIDIARELKKLWNMKVTIVSIGIGVFGTVTKMLLKRLVDLKIGGWVETIQTTVLLRTAKILRRVLETWGDLLSLKPSA